MVKYKYFGRKSPYVGKTLWEIVGNLKNFGVGRLILKSDTLEFPEPSFFKILQIQPLAEPQDKLQNRNVIAWIEEVFRGKKIEKIVEASQNSYPKYMLVPKYEEEKYYKLQEKYKDIETRQIIPTVVDWPPLLKKIYERNLSFDNSNLPDIKTILHDREYKNIKLGEGKSVTPKQYCSLYTGEVSVDDNIKEIVKLQKIVNSYKQKESAAE